MEELIKVTPDKEKAKSILKMVDTTIEMVADIDIEKFPSNITKEYYDIIRELISIILLLDGYKTYGDGAHRKQIEYIQRNCKQFNEYEIGFINELRVLRNKISYDGYFVPDEYITRNISNIRALISKLRIIVREKQEN